MNYKDKQEWIEAVMSSDLTPATKVYAFGIYKHMYGLKDDSFPGAKALREATGLNDSHFWKYNQALKEAGFIEVTSRRGTSNEYRLTEVTSTRGRYLPPEEVGLPPEEVGVTSTGGTNTTKNTSSKTTSKTSSTAAGAPVEDGPSPTLEEVPEVEWDIDTCLNSQTTTAAADSNLKTATHLPPQEVTPTGSVLSAEERRAKAAKHIYTSEADLRERRERLLGRKS